MDESELSRTDPTQPDQLTWVDSTLRPDFPARQTPALIQPAEAVEGMCYVVSPDNGKTIYAICTDFDFARQLQVRLLQDNITTLCHPIRTNKLLISTVR